MAGAERWPEGWTASGVERTGYANLVHVSWEAACCGDRCLAAFRGKSLTLVRASWPVREIAPQRGIAARGSETGATEIRRTLP